MPAYASFQDLMINNIIPFAQRTGWKRFDGASGGNRKVYATFHHEGKVWKIHSDSQIGIFLAVYKQDPTGATSLKIDYTSNNKEKLIPATGPQNGMYVYRYN